MPTAIGLHNRNTHAFLLTAAVKGHALPGCADSIFFLICVVVGRVDAEHHHIHDVYVQHLVYHGGVMGGKADMPHLALLFVFLHHLQYPALQSLVQFGLLIDAMDKPKVHVIRFQFAQMHFHGRFDFFPAMG